MGFFYVDSNVGTRTSGGSMAQQTGSFAALGAANVYATIGAALADAAPPVSGDVIVCSNDHLDTSSTATLQEILPPGVSLISASAADCAAYSKGATLQTTSNANFSVNLSLAASGATRVRGFVLQSIGSISIFGNNLALNTEVADCTLDCGTGNGSSARVIVGAQSDFSRSWSVENCIAKFHNSSSGFSINGGTLNVVKLSGDAASAKLANQVFVVGTRGALLYGRGLDLTNLLGSTCAVVGFSAGANGSVRLRDVTVPAGWTGTLASATPNPGVRAEMYNYGSDAVNYHFAIADNAGNIYDESTIVKAGTAFNVGGQDLSLKMVSNSNAAEFNPLVSQTFSLYNTATGAAKTITIPILHDSLTNLTDADIWVQVRYKNSSSYQIAEQIDDSRASILVASADHAADTSTWTTTGLTNPNKQKLDVIFTPQMEGEVEFEICLAKPGYTIYADIPDALT